MSFAKRGVHLDYISNQLLVEVYTKAILLELDQDFIDMLKEEITRRGININEYL